MKTFVKTIPAKLWDRETRSWHTALVHTEIDIDIDRLLSLVADKVLKNKSRQTTMLSGIVKGRGHTIPPREAT